MSHPILPKTVAFDKVWIHLCTGSVENSEYFMCHFCCQIDKELSVCHTLLSELGGHDESWPFLNPVNTKQFPTYKKIIKSPMDISTIRKKLNDGMWVNLTFKYFPCPSVQIKKYVYIKSTTMFVPSSEIGTLPTPLSPASVPLPQNREEGGHTRLWVGVGGAPIPTTWEKLSTLPAYSVVQMISL